MVIKSTWHIIVFIFLIYETVKRFMKQLGPEHKMKYIFIVQWVELLNVFVFARRVRSSLHEMILEWHLHSHGRQEETEILSQMFPIENVTESFQDQATVSSFNPTPRQFSRPKWPPKAVAKDKAGKKKKKSKILPRLLRIPPRRSDSEMIWAAEGGPCSPSRCVRHGPCCRECARWPCRWSSPSLPPLQPHK